MEKNQKLSEITAEIADQINFLKYMADQVSAFSAHITKISDNITKYDRDLKILDNVSIDRPAGESAAVPIKPEKTAGCNTPFLPNNPERRRESPKPCSSGLPRNVPGSGNLSNIIPFPARGFCTARDCARGLVNSGSNVLLAAPDAAFPAGVPDFRSQLQRDGLILLAWDKRMTEAGERYTAYWVTSVGIPRYYASKQFSCDEFPFAVPDHKSYAAEDGIEFFGQQAPLSLVHVAPELMMSNPRHSELRQPHIRMLKLRGSLTDYDYKYLLTKEKKRQLSCRKSRDQSPGVNTPA